MKTPSIKVSTSATPSTLALGWFESEKSTDAKKESKDSTPGPHYAGKSKKDLERLLQDLKESKHFSGKKNEVDFLRYYSFEGAKNLFLLGLGATKKWSPEQARQAGAALSLAQRRARVASVGLQGDSVFTGKGKEDLSSFVQAFCEGYLMAGHEFRDLKKEDKGLFSPEGLEILDVKGATVENAVKDAEIIATSVNFARTLGDRPGNVLTPTVFANLVSAMAKESGLKCTVLGKKEIEKEKMGLFLGVSQGSAEEPKFMILEHRKGKKGDKPIVLVGKGITFDSGGISLKPAAKMEDMKYDMMGAGAVAGIMRAVGKLGIEQNIVGVIAACENMPGGKAQKPGDVQRSRKGKTVEIINTDAEGRLILADALEYVQDKLDPQAILDFATLTGAVVDALGTVVSGVMGNHEELIERVKSASVATGERVWPLPLYDEYEEDLRSSVADIKNSGIREAGSSKGGIFLRYFVDSSFPWVHCDIAGTAYNRRDLNYHPQKYGSGVMIRLITHMLQNWKPLKR